MNRRGLFARVETTFAETRPSPNLLLPAHSATTPKTDVRVLALSQRHPAICGCWKIRETSLAVRLADSRSCATVADTWYAGRRLWLRPGKLYLFGRTRTERT